VFALLAMLHKQMHANRRQSTSSSRASWSAACSPPPRVTMARVSMLAARLLSVMMAYRLQSTSGDAHSLMSDGGVFALTIAIMFAAAHEMLYRASADARCTSSRSLFAMSISGRKPPALTMGTRFCRLAARLHSAKPA
jgi:hypothetical protein